MKKILLLAMVLFFINLSRHSFATEIRLLGARSDIDPAADYFILLTKLILNKGSKASQYKFIIKSQNRISQGRKLKLLDDDYVDLIWTGANHDREKKYLAIPVPLLSGLLGYRISLIHRDNLQKFKNIKNPDELKNYIACLGAHWPDADVFEENGYKVHRMIHFDAMFQMIERKRCDYFPRSIFEGYLEQKKIVKRYPNIVVIDDFILHYPFGSYFFVKKENIELANKLTLGLKLAIEDGSFLKLLKNNKLTNHLFPIDKWYEKKYFELTNSNFSFQNFNNSAPLLIKLNVKQ